MNRFLRIVTRVGKDVGKVSLKTVETVAPVALSLVNPELGQALNAGIKILKGNDAPMNSLEQFAITMILGMLQTVVKDPKAKATLQNQLLGVASDILLAYGLVPPSLPTTGATVATPTA